MTHPLSIRLFVWLIYLISDCHLGGRAGGSLYFYIDNTDFSEKWEGEEEEMLWLFPGCFFRSAGRMPGRSSRHQWVVLRPFLYLFDTTANPTHIILSLWLARSVEGKIGVSVKTWLFFSQKVRKLTTVDIPNSLGLQEKRSLKRQY